MGISVFLIVLNEEKKIAKALASVAWADERIVVDGGSSDRTAEISRQQNAKVFLRPFDNFEEQKNYALTLTRNDWVLSLDADEQVTPALRDEMLKKTASGGNFAGYRMKRRNLFLGKPLRHSRQGKDWVLRLFRKNMGTFQGVIHETVSLNGKVGELEQVLEHAGTETLSDYFAKLKRYTDLEAERIRKEGRTPTLAKALLFPVGLWVRDYILLGGCLDGWHGFLYHTLSCYYGWLKNFKARFKSH